MSYKCIREVYEAAADAADTIRGELKHYPDSDIHELVQQEATTQVIWTSDNWEVCNIMRCSDESYAAEDNLSLGDYESINGYFEALAFAIWEQLINEALQED